MSDKGGAGDGLDRVLAAELDSWEAAGLRRRLREVEGKPGRMIALEGREVLQFASNDYLGLAGEPFMAEAAARAARDYGSGSGASRLICGSQSPHVRLEEALAAFKQCEAALTFSTGHATALGVIPALAGRGDVVILDKLAHACLVDGARLSGAALRVFRHNDLAQLESHLHWAGRKHPGARVWVVTESVFSMDGDLAPLREIVELKERHGAWLMLDEAHAVGLMGPKGSGLVEVLGLHGRVEVQMGTLGKALGAGGGYIAGSRVLVDYLVNRCRSFLFSTAPPPAQAAAALAALEWLPGPEGMARRQRLEGLRESVAREMAGLPIQPPPAAIVPIHAGSERRALDWAAACREAGILIPAIRYPTVARGAARLRLTLNACHRDEDLRRAAEVLRCVAAGRLG